MTRAVVQGGAASISSLIVALDLEMAGGGSSLCRSSSKGGAETGNDREVGEDGGSGDLEE